MIWYFHVDSSPTLCPPNYDHYERSALYEPETSMNKHQPFRYSVWELNESKDHLIPDSSVIGAQLSKGITLQQGTYTVQQNCGDTKIINDQTKQIIYQYAGTILLQYEGDPDTTPPSLTVPPDITIPQNSAFNPMDGVSASDDVDGDITANVKTTPNDVDTSKLGDTTLTYSVADSAGNKTNAQRKVTVVSSGTTIACAPQTGADPASSVWQSATFILSAVSFGLAVLAVRSWRRLRRSI